MELICKNCGKSITKWSKLQLCISCCKIGLKHPHSEESKNKISIATKRVMNASKMKRKLSNSFKGRIYSEKTRKAMSISRIGSNHWNWQGGKTELSHLIRNLQENKNWIQEIFKRDDYTCQECYERGVSLEAHHIKSFAIIFKEFLQTYNQFSPIEDKETLVRLAVSYVPFWDIDNGKTLCEDCHNKTKTLLKQEASELWS